MTPPPRSPLSSDPGPLRPTDGELRRADAGRTLAVALEQLVRLEDAVLRLRERPTRQRRLTWRRRLHLAEHLRRVRLLFLEAARDAAWQETALVGETALLELEQELGARPWNEVADERRVGLTRALLGVRRGRRIIERLELQLRDLEREARDLRRGA